jgi:two-component system sensor histidine kinase BaeS
MIDSVVNEFKNPLCVLRSCMDSLRSSLVDPELLKITEVMARAAESMIDRTEEILEFTAGQESLKIESIPLRSLAEQLEERARKILPDAIELTLELEFEFERDTAVQGDPTRLLRMFMSLVKNAIESMPDGGSLHVSVQRRGSQAAFLISDSGCGIAPELHASIFEPFVSHGNEGGSGLGMATVKRVVEAHGGTVSLRSEPGLGTEVEVRLPTTL